MALGLFLVNLCITASLADVVKDKLFENVPADVWTGILYTVGAVLAALLIDARSLWCMFFDIKSKDRQHPFALVLGIRDCASASFPLYVVILNWTAAYGLVSSALKLSMFNPVKNYEFTAPTPEIAHDLFSGELQLNSLLRKGSESYWESYYGHACCFYLVTYFLSLSAHRLGFAFNPQLYVQKGAIYLVTCLVLGAFGGYWASATRFFTAMVLLMHGLLPVLFAFARRTLVASNMEHLGSNELSPMRNALASMCISTMVAAVMVAALKSALDSDVNMFQHADPAKGIYLQFCEEPYYYVSWAAQGVALLLHMPYLPIFLCLFYWRQMDADMKTLLAFQIPLQLWTGIGHYLPDPRVAKVTEISILLADLYFIQFIKMCSTFPKGFTVWNAGMVYVPFAWFVYSTFGLLTYILSGAITFPMIAVTNKCVWTSWQVGSLTSTKEKVIGTFLLLLAPIIIVVEATFCQSLLGKIPFPYHSLFDLNFFQVATTYWLSVASNAQAKAKSNSAGLKRE
eukprot:CAMPEP_0172814470 /NCGR_PEP_ID=MMETSP1075-20121228/11250_1 /TAXON_ID=2916 /ORGANISM="Ceratium fusus, Strain PA161109" /LENGTH=512 /DNA_ID=CAMNT_0013654267 /DNA_START=89 /DNA_END=1627 /DNA_ORIENTATION=+